VDGVLAAVVVGGPAARSTAVGWGAALVGLALVALLLGYGGYVLRVLSVRRAGGHLEVTGPGGEAVGTLPVPARPEVTVGAAGCGAAAVRLPCLPGGDALFRIRVEVDTTGGPWRAGLAAWRRRPAAVLWAEAVWPYHLYSPHSGPLPRRRVDLDGSAPFSAGGLTFFYAGPGAAAGVAPAPVADLLGGLGDAASGSIVQMPAPAGLSTGGRAFTAALGAAAQWLGRVAATWAARTGRALLHGAGAAARWSWRVVPATTSAAARWSGGMARAWLAAAGLAGGLALRSLLAWLVTAVVDVGRGCLRALAAAAVWAVGGMVRGIAGAGAWVVADLALALQFGEEEAVAGALRLPPGVRRAPPPAGASRGPGQDLLDFLRAAERQ